MRKTTLGICGSLCLFLLSWPATGDMGAIVPLGDVRLTEPGQKAIIAHDGFEELLILGTDLQASATANVLRFIPLPAEPDVTLAPHDCLANLAALVGKHHLQYVIQYRSGPPKQDAVEIRSHQQLGLHDVTIVRVKDSDHFAAWANGFFKSKGLPQRKLTPSESQMVADYVSRGFVFFVFDLVELTPQIRSVDPLVYRFPTKYMYYPLKTSNLIGGEGRVELFVFSDRGGLFPRRYRPGEMSLELDFFTKSTTAVVMGEEMKSICPAIAELLGSQAILQAFKFDGKLSFEDDIGVPIQIDELAPYDPRKPRTLPGRSPLPSDEETDKASN